MEEVGRPCLSRLAGRRGPALLVGIAEARRGEARRGEARAVPGVSYRGLHPASARATAAARGSSRKADTRCELVLRRALWARGLRYRIDVAKLPGRPDIMLEQAQIVVFCDGDFWHGRDLPAREERLARGHNPGYWLSKIQGNVARDRRSDDALRSAGWTVLRYWESDILRSVDAIADAIVSLARERACPRRT